MKNANLSGINIDWSIQELQNLLAENHSASSDADIKHFTSISTCLGPLLKALNWRGELRHVLEAMPHFESVETINDIRNILVRLNYDSKAQACALSDLRKRTFLVFMSVAATISTRY